MNYYSSHSFFVDKFEKLSEKNECKVATEQFYIFRASME